MLCPKCRCEMRISNTRYPTEGDTSPDTATKVFVEQDLSCRNPKCENYNKVVQTIRSELKIN